MWKAEYLTHDGQQIFSLYHPPLKERESREGVIICPPAPYEIRRSHRALRNLAQNLAKAGYHVIRFDYRGTGDSSGNADDWSLDAWKRDIKLVSEHFRNHYDLSRLSLVGLRLGASLGLLSLDPKTLKRIVLWDPIFDGADYLKALHASHKELVEREADRPPYARKPSKPQLLGFPHTKAWHNDISDFRLDIHPQVRGFVVHSDDKNRHHSIGLMRRLEVNDDQRWSSSRVLHLQSFAHPSITAIEQALEGKVGV